MKNIYKPKNPTGYDGPFEVSDDYPTMVPFTEVPVPEGLYSPSFDFGLNQWVETAPVEMIAVINDLKAQTANLGQSTIKLSINDMKMQKEIETLKSEGGEA